MAAPADHATAPVALPPAAAGGKAIPAARFGAAAEAFLVPVGALIVSLALFGIFTAFAGVSPLAVYANLADGAFGSWFSIQNTLTRASPLILTEIGRAHV